MEKNPCQELYKTFVEAGKEWSAAAHATIKHVTTEETDQNDLPILNQEGVEEMILSYETERKAKDKYFEIANQLIMCQKKHQ